MAVVRITTGGREFRREIGNRLVIGRDIECDVRVDDPKISRLHCLIERNGDEYVAVDLDSHNGTMICGWPLTRQTLKHGDVLDMGIASLQFLIEAARKTANEAAALADDTHILAGLPCTGPVAASVSAHSPSNTYRAPTRQSSLWEHAMRASERATTKKSRKRKRVKPEVLRKQLLAGKTQSGVNEVTRIVRPAYAAPWYHRTVPLKLGIPASLALIALLYVLTNGAPSINFGSHNHSDVPKGLFHSSPNNND